MTLAQEPQQRDPVWKLPERPIAVLVMVSGSDDRTTMIDLSTHPCGQHIVDDYAAGAELVSVDHLWAEPAGTAAEPARPV
ncbi:MAG: hypothetical protein Q8O61_03535 [Nocardioides sp.]|nr:hypothetical protein [Nocardioides sp.]